MPAVYLGRRGTHFVFRLTLQGKPVVAYYPPWLVDPDGPHPIDCTTVAFPAWLVDRWGPYQIDCTTVARSDERDDSGHTISVGD